MAGPTTVVLKLFGGGPNSNMVNRYRIYRSDGAQFTDSSAGLTSGALVLDVTSGTELTGFEPPIGNLATAPYTAQPGTGPGWTPDPFQVVVRGYTSNAGSNTPITGSVVLDKDTWLRDTNDTTGTSVKCTLYMTSACFTDIILEVPV